MGEKKDGGGGVNLTPLDFQNRRVLVHAMVYFDVKLTPWI